MDTQVIIYIVVWLAVLLISTWIAFLYEEYTKITIITVISLTILFIALKLFNIIFRDWLRIFSLILISIIGIAIFKICDRLGIC